MLLFKPEVSILNFRYVKIMDIRFGFVVVKIEYIFFFQKKKQNILNQHEVICIFVQGFKPSLDNTVTSAIYTVTLMLWPRVHDKRSLQYFKSGLVISNEIHRLRIILFLHLQQNKKKSLFIQLGYHEMSDLLNRSYRIVGMLRQIFAFTLCKSVYKRQDSDNL